MPQTELPPVGLGTWQNTDPEQCVESVAAALDMGYRHIDTAHYYGNEEDVGRGIAESDVAREDITVATKVHAETTGLDYDGVVEGAELSCERLGLDYLDLFYVHWPIFEYDPEETLSAFRDLKEDGVIEHVGLSNFTPEYLDDAIDALGEVPFALQMEMHPYCQQEELLEYAQREDFWLVAYSPLARGNVFEDPVIGDIAENHGVSEAQVSLAWLLSKENVRVIPKASSEAHIRDNLAATELDLDEAELARIDGIEKEERYVERDNSPWLES